MSSHALTLLGEVERVTFENEGTGFRVVRLGKLEGAGERRQLVVVGTFPAVGPGTRVRVTGRLETDARHGEQLRAESLVALAPDTLEGLERYLGSGVIEGVGPGFAKRIVRTFGMDALRVLDAEPWRLREVAGIGEGRVEQIRKGWTEQRALTNVMLLLQSHGASAALAARIVKQYGDRAAEVVQKNPYRLAMDVWGVGFKTADRLARSQGLTREHPERVQAGVLHELRALSDSGHVYAPRGLLEERAANMLEIDVSHVAAAVDVLWTAERVVVEDGRVFLAKLHDAEVTVSECLRQLLSAPSAQLSLLEAALGDFQDQRGIELAPQQRRAVEAAGRHKVAIITGGPGVGKTTIVQAILDVARRSRLRVRLAAPTGRAAKRLTEATGQEATTLHRLLEVDPRSGRFQRDGEHPLEADMVIVDETSMVDLPLAAALLRALPLQARLVLVGDADQLPSVGPGAVLRDLIASECIPVVRLDVVFRQAGQSGIVEGAHRILHGEAPEGSNVADGDFFIIECREPERAAQLVQQVVAERIPRRFGFDPIDAVQVLTPMHRGPAGTAALNERLQGLLNPSGAALESGGRVLRTGDKVLQTRNDYDKDVFNGDVGRILSVAPEEGSLVVRFDGRDVTYQRGEQDALALAYATTIHKSQGSEYPAVVIPLLTTHFVMLSRNLVYTAVTRAKKLCVLVADPKALALALAETRKEERLTGLAERLRA
jgi:exodeoxyribonuclease V alpha subunit